MKLQLRTSSATEKAPIFQSPFKMSREFPDVLKSVLVRVKRTIKRLTKFFKSTDYSSEVLERQENLTTFKMKTWKKNTPQTRSRGRQYGKYVKRWTSCIITNKNNNEHTVHLTSDKTVRIVIQMALSAQEPVTYC